MLERLLTPKEAAERLGITVHCMATWRSNKRYDLPYRKIGRLVRYSNDDLLNFIERNRHASFEQGRKRG